MRRFMLVVLGCAIFAWLAWAFWAAYRPSALLLQGEIEAQQYNVSSKVPGRIAAVYVRRGDSVAVGDRIFLMDSPEVDAKRQQAQGAARSAEALARMARDGARDQEVRAARDQWRVAQAARELAEKTWQRLDALYEDGVIPAQRRDEALAALQAARFPEEAALEVLSLTEEGAREEAIDAAEGQVEAAEGLVAEVDAAADDVLIASRWDGEVANVFLHAGELAPQGFPVVTLVDLADAWALFQVREDLLHRFPMGSVHEVRLPGLQDRIVTMRVVRSSVLGEFATWRATHGSGAFDLRTFEVELRPEAPIDGLRAGMSVLMELEP